MELSEFIASTIIGIAQGVKSAQEREKELGFCVNPTSMRPYDNSPTNIGGVTNIDGIERMVKFVDFDLLVEAQNTTGKNTGGGINVLDAIQIGGKKEKSEIEKSANRIKFSIAMTYPKGNY